MSAQLSASEHAWIPRDADTWWLRVLWSIANPADQPLHVLVAGPVSIREGEPMVLDHTVGGQPDDVDWNAEPDLAFRVADADGTLDVARAYPLPPLGTMTELTLVARLSVGYEPPDPVWATMRMWDAVAAWEAVLESAPLCARTPANPRG